LACAILVGHNGHSHNPRVVTVVTVVSGGRFLVTGHNPRVVTSLWRGNRTEKGARCPQSVILQMLNDVTLSRAFLRTAKGRVKTKNPLPSNSEE